MSIKPEEILPDDKSQVNLNGITVRKGTVAAALANADLLESDEATEAQKSEALQTIKELAPALVAVGLAKHLTWKNPTIQNIVDWIRAGK